jgi:sulfur carrier protein
MSKIKVNGNEQEISNPVSLTELIALNNVAQPSMVSIQLNGEFVVRDDYDSTLVKEGDEVDFLYFMGGGSNSYQLIVII